MSTMGVCEEEGDVLSTGASEAEAAAARSAVATLVSEEYPMLRSIEERMEVHIRPAAGWNKARMVEWIVSQVRSPLLLEDAGGRDARGAAGLPQP